MRGDLGGDLVGCEAVAEALPRMLDGTRRADRILLRHAATCLRCQAEMARYRRMLRLLHQLRSQWPRSVSEAPAGTVPRDVEQLAVHERRRPGAQPRLGAMPAGRRQLAAALAAATAVAGVGAAAAVAAAARSRPAVRRPAPCRSHRLC